MRSITPLTYLLLGLNYYYREHECNQGISSCLRAFSGPSAG